MIYLGPVRHPVQLLDGQVQEFDFHFFESDTGRYVVAKRGELRNCENVLLRVESACIFGHIFNVVRCDCQFQLEQAIYQIAKENQGLLIYGVDQDGRGLGIKGHFQTYILRQHERLDTKQVYARLGRKPDERDYTDIVQIIRWFEIKSVRILTNNPRRVRWLEDSGISFERAPLEIKLNKYNESCLMDEKDDLGYLFTFKTHREWLGEVEERLSKEEIKSTEVSGCIIVSENQVISEAYANLENPHTVLAALAQAGDKTHNLTVYVVGIPCNTCLLKLSESGVRKVILSTADLNKVTENLNPSFSLILEGIDVKLGT